MSTINELTQLLIIGASTGMCGGIGFWSAAVVVNRLTGGRLMRVMTGSRV